MCLKIVSNTLIYVTLQHFCRVTGTSGNSGQEKFWTAWGNFKHETKIASIIFLYYLCHCRLLFQESNNCLVILGAIKRFCVVALYFRLGL